jgi:hypothetical protein
LTRKAASFTAKVKARIGVHADSLRPTRLRWLSEGDFYALTSRMQLNSLSSGSRPIAFENPIHVAVRSSRAVMEKPDASGIDLARETKKLIRTTVSPEWFILFR